MSAIQRDSRGRFLPGNTIGRKGAAVTHQRHRDKLSLWGRMGYRALVRKYFDGDKDEANKWLEKKGHHAQDQQNGYSNFFFSSKDPGPHPAHIERSWGTDKRTVAEINASGELPF